MGLYLGIDASTQGMTGLIIDTHSGRILHACSLDYGRDLPEYDSPHGLLPHPDPLVKHADPLMWAAAMETLFERLAAAGAPLARLAGVSGSGQQHGTVYLAAPLRTAFAGKAKNLAAAVAPCLSRRTAPIWMDSSTSEECAEITRSLGSVAEVRRRSGSAAIERFSGPQIRRFAKTCPADYQRTAVIHLVSSFLCSLLLGQDAPIDTGDGAGMNLLNLETGLWDSALLNATATDLEQRLPPVVPSARVVGQLAPRVAHRYGIAPQAKVVAWSGDNPSSLIGVGGWRPGTAVISLGTSDTYFAAMPTACVDPQGYGHVFGNPAGGFMSLICFKNGSLARERVRDRFALDWETFDAYCRQGSPGNGGPNLVLPYFVPEITPLVLQPKPLYRGTSRFLEHADAAAAVRAIVESQALSMRLHTAWMQPRPTTLHLTGGGSRSTNLCRIFADVFNARVQRLQVSDSAALGAAMRAANAVEGIPWDELTDMFCSAGALPVLQPDAANAAQYNDLLQAYASLEATCLADAPTARACR